MRRSAAIAAAVLDGGATGQAAGVWPRHAVPLLLAGSLLLGVAHVAFLPPWEGFDERPHYAYIQQVADRRELPRRPWARYSTDVEAYEAVGPLPYATRPPMERTGALTYRALFESPPDVIARARAAVHDRPEVAREYRPGERRNLQVQHPPLYYALLAPLYRGTRHWSLGAQLLVLRGASYLLAWMALVLGVVACRAALRAAVVAGEDRPVWGWAMGALAAWPALLPGWFPEMARIGNDSLCAVLVAGVWIVSLRGSPRLTLAQGAALGALLGLGALTKAFFVPITAGVLSFWLFAAWRGAGWRGVRRVLGPVALAAILALAVAGWWYYDNWARHGVALGSGELIAVTRRGGLRAGLTRGFSLTEWARGHAAALATFVWPGTWSWARPPHVLFVPLMLIAVGGAVGYVLALRRLGRGGLAELPLWMAGPVLVGLSYHVLVRLALVGEGRGTGGYYVHMLVVPLGVAFGLAAGTWFQRPTVQRLAGGLAAYAVAFGIGVSWAQVLLFAGILYKAGTSRFYQVPAALPPWLGVPTALDRLRVLAFPDLGAAAWAFGGGLVLAGLACLAREVRALPRLDKTTGRASPMGSAQSHGA